MARRVTCFICRKECDATDRNADGSYAHRGCLVRYQTRPEHFRPKKEGK